MDTIDKCIEPHVTVDDERAVELVTDPTLIGNVVNDLWRNVLTEDEKLAVVAELGTNDEGSCCKALRKAMAHVISEHWSSLQKAAA